MTPNKDMPAFPVLEEGNISAGVTKLEFFACNAPNEIPGWFVHVSPTSNVTPKPQWHTLPKNDQEHIKCWSSDGQELPDHLKWFGDQYEKHIEEDKAYRVADIKAKYFQWRRYYAEQLLSELSKTQP